MLTDIRYTLRLLRRSPSFTLTAVLMLALGIGATTAIYSVVYGLLLRPLPVLDEASLVIAYATDPGIRENAPISYPKFLEWRGSAAFDDVAAVSATRLDLAGGAAEQVDAAYVSGNFFAVLGVEAALGRVISESDRHAAETPAVISDTLWRRRFSGNPAILGSHLSAGDLRLTVVGVMPPGFERWRRETHVWLPLEAGVTTAQLGSRGWHLFTAVGRLRSGWSATQAAAMLVAADMENYRRVEAQSPGNGDTTGVRLVALRDDVVPARTRRLVLVLMVAIALTWIVVCTNLATLLLARGVSRRPEMALRIALGADRARLIRQMLLEGIVLAIPAGSFGALLAAWATGVLVSVAPSALFDLHAVEFDEPIIFFAAGLSAASILAFGGLPALRLSQAAPHGSLQQRAGARTTRLNHALIAGQIAAALMVVVGASLLTKSLVRMQRVELGFSPERVLTLEVSLPAASYGVARAIDDPRYLQAQRELLVQLGSMAGVDAVTFGTGIFVPHDDNRTSIQLDDGRRFVNGNPKDRAMAPGAHFVGPDYFKVHGAHVSAGREFGARDVFNAPMVVVVNETMARLHWPGENPIGKRVNFGRRTRRELDEPWAEVVGVVRDVRHGGVEQAPRPHVYRSAMQHPRREFEVMIRTMIPPARVAAEARRVIQRFDPNIPIVSMAVLDDTVRDATAATRYASALLSLFAAITTVLCAAGLYGVLAYAVTMRRREIGIRMALGAAPARLVCDVLRAGSRMTAAGIVAGLAAAVAGSRLLGSLLYEVSPHDPYVFAGTAWAVAIIALAAAYIPARRAARVDPMIALRAE